jgi:replicative DNA helicase
MADITPESMLVGVMLLDPQARADAWVRGINPDVFHDHRLGVIVERVMAMDEAGYPVDIITLQHSLTQRGEDISVDDLRDMQDLVIEDHKARTAWIAAADVIEQIRLDPNLDALPALAEALRSMSSNKEVPKSGGWYADLIPAYLDQVQGIWAGDAQPFIPTGFSSIDKLQRGGLYEGELTIAAGRPGSGKTALALCVAQNVARQGKRVVFFSAEMTARAMLRRAAAEFTGIATWLVDKPGDLGDERNRKMRATYMAKVKNDLAQLPVWVDDRSNPTTQYMREVVERIGDVAFVVFDYLSLSGEVSKRDNEVDRMTAVSLGLQRLAKDYKIPVLALAQLNRSVEGDGNRRNEYRPALSHIRDSGQIEANAHNVWLLYRRLYYVQQGMIEAKFDERDVMDVHVGKNREGETGVVRLSFDGPTFSLKDTTD